MKPKNFPLRKMLRQARAQGRSLTESERQQARAKRTKKAGGKSERLYRRLG